MILSKDVVYSMALNLRGYRTHFIICDGVPEACFQRGFEKGELLEAWSEGCQGCAGEMTKIAKKYGIDCSFSDKYISKEQRAVFKKLSQDIEIDQILDFEYFGVRVGELAWSSLNRYMKGYIVSSADLDAQTQLVYRKYLYAGLVNTFISSEVINKYEPVSVLTAHGVYVDCAPPIMLALQKGIKSISWASGFKNRHFYFTIPKSINKLELRGIRTEEWAKRKARSLSAHEATVLDEYIHSRYVDAKARDIDILAKPESKDVLKERLGIHNDNLIVCVFSHVNWDACFDLATMVFKTANEWTIETIKKAAAITDVNWIIRVHPGEIKDGSLYTTSDLIKRVFPEVPEHIKIIWHDSDINSYGLYKLIDAGITIMGTVGVELPLFGKPIITAGEAHFAGKGFSIDSKTQEEYFSILDNIREIQPLTAEQIALARQYAYSYFVERQIPLRMTKKSDGHWGEVDLRKLDQLLPGKDSVMDIICDGVVNGKDVILDEATIERMYK